MKKILTLITSALVISGSSAFAWVGGPWSNNSYSQTTTGTYQAVMYMTNGVGLAVFQMIPLRLSPKLIHQSFSTKELFTLVNALEQQIVLQEKVLDQ